MVHIRFSQFFSLFISFSLLIASLPLSAMTQPTSHDLDASYIYCGPEMSNIVKTISQLSDLDDNNNSPLHELDEYIKKGFYLAEYDAFMEILEYAGILLQEKHEQLDCVQRKKINYELNAILEQIVSGELVVNALNEKDFQDKIDKKVISLSSSLQELDQDGAIDLTITRTLVEFAPALVVSLTNVNVATGGLLTIDGITLTAGARVLLVGQTNPVENGLWVASSGAWSYASDWTGTPDQAYVLIQEGAANGGSGWLCTTPTAVIGTDPINFMEFVLPSETTGANVGVGTGLVYQGQSGLTLNFRSLLAGDSYTAITNNTNEVVIGINATNANTASTIVARDASGSFAAGLISVTDEVISSSVTIAPFSAAGVIHNNTSGLLSSSLIVNADISSSAGITDSKLATIFTAGKVNNSATTANSSNLANAIVARDGSGNFGASTITANLIGNASTATSATTATTATNFTGSLVGNVIGTQGATVVANVGGQTASSVAAATTLANSATNLDTVSAIVRRDASGSFAAGVISVTDVVISNTFAMTPFNNAGVLHNNTSGSISSSLITNADISSSAAIDNSKLATLSTAGLVANSATSATSLNTASAIVARDTSGNFSANIVIANLIGAASLNVLRTGDTMTGTLQLPAGTTAAPSLIFTGSTTAGLSAISGNLSFSTNALARLKISSGGIVSIPTFTSPGVLHNDSSGNFSSSFITNSDIIAGAGITDNKLATLSSTGKVNNSATTATSNSSTNTIVSRDSSGNFAAQTITVTDVNMSGNLTLSTDPSTATAGNIFKGSNIPFIHNFGTFNTFMGEYTGNFTMSGNGQNSVLGAFALSSNNTGDNNTAVGFAALPAYTDGTNNIAIGSGAGGTLTTGSGNIYINANANTSTEFSTTRIGTSQTSCFIAGIRGITTGNANGVAVLIDSAGQLGTISSSASVKHDIKDMNEASSNVLQLRPVTFVYNADESNTIQYGLIAEEVDEIFPAIVAKDEKGRAETIQYHVLPVLLLNEIKKQQAIIHEQGESITNFAIRMDMMDKAIASLQACIRKNVADA